MDSFRKWLDSFNSENEKGLKKIYACKKSLKEYYDKYANYDEEVKNSDTQCDLKNKVDEI